MVAFLQNIIAGLETGSLYALAALGLVLIFRTSGVINFAQGEMAMFSSFIALTLFQHNMPYPVAFIGAILFAVALGYIVERVFIRPASKANLVSKMIITLGLIMIFSGLATAIFGTDSYFFRKAITADNLNAGGVIIQPNALFIIAITLLIMGILFYIIKKTMVGIAIRATAQNEKTAKLMGISVSKIYSMSWIIATVLGAIAGVLIAPTTNISTAMMMDVHLKSFIAAVLGGFGSFIGPVFGGFSIGVFDNLVGYYISLKWKTVIVYGLLILILIFKPTGLFGKSYRKKV
ncbi:branched-chain amino acid ABC transporter permease [Paraliobacillus quinghaiensis]|uniref:Branched-chain amino acid ABC transporter permease n=1 Tax=Paraliobacillus quinghaiensis TaxID=470815 RepID=A0A917WXG8_9BACI|nr:branched-chain amino acid ABC transporter permease [Paraliobacillus quinghaiensis]GGM42119.1 branched-chain amino acid ABC transporter permease [Paraliobacillus quinghaiensis]